jgi:hypothetical protein
VFREPKRSVSAAPTTPPANISHSLMASSDDRPRQNDRNSGPGLGRRRWEPVGVERLRVWHKDCKREYADDRADKNWVRNC